jgi:hypothetical protein
LRFPSGEFIRSRWRYGTLPDQMRNGLHSLLRADGTLADPMRDGHHSLR